MSRSPKDHRRSFLGRSADTLLLLANLMVLAVLVAAGYSQMVHPARFSWLVAAGLTFPLWLAASVAFALWWLVRRRRYLVCSLMGWAACAAPIRTFFPLNPGGQVADGSIKVLSYNVEGFTTGGGDSEAFRQQLDYLSRSEAHFMCLQEAMCYHDSPKYRPLRKALSQWPYQDTLRLSNSNGLAFCSRYPIVGRHVVPAQNRNYGAAIYKVIMEGDTVAVVNCHFISNAMDEQDKRMYREVVTVPTDRSNKNNIRHLARKVDGAGVARAQQADALGAAIGRLGDMPVILCGDFNDSPISYTHYRLTRILNDAYTRSGRGPGITYHKSGMYFRLDNILCSHHWKAAQARVDRDMPHSDHYPIHAYLKLVQHKRH
ncbi:MAG: endonuclease/exonuclease/phosphatase family protein [Bacteroidaceae bacterium]|nr:endonuclease/exonuclease/phosphatase family protein [Bacteroidaceae bacterium]